MLGKDRKRVIIKMSIFIVSLCHLSVFLSAETIKVPQDYPTIKGAVSSASHGDTIEVDDGFYFEKDIVIDKKLHIKSKNLFGAIVDGGESVKRSIFLVRTEVEIERFILKNARHAIMQRHSLDVGWTAHDLAIVDCDIAICINDKEKNIGSLSAYNIIVNRAKSAFSTNDARCMVVNNCLITNCKNAFSGSNHIEFSVNNISV